MFVSIRKYRMLGPMDELVRKVEAEFVPILREVPGFRGYHVIDCGNSQIVSVSIFDSRDSALASNDKARGWVERSISHLVQGPPEVTAGESRLDVGI